MTKIIWTVSSLALLAACSPPAENSASNAAGEAAGVTGATSIESGPSAQADSTSVPPADGRERFYGRETFTIVYKQTGTEAGDVTEHVRDFGRSRAEITKTSLTMAGMTINKDTRVIYSGADIVTVDNAAGTVTTSVNPFYDRVVAAIRDRSGVEFGKSMMTSMGGRETGESGSFAGQSCSYWELTSMGARSCVTPWGATLHTSVSLGPVTYERTATDVRLGDGGPDAAFAYDASRASAQPNLQDVLRNIPGRN